MKKFVYVSVLALALVAMISGAALAGDGHNHGKKVGDHPKKTAEKVKKAGEHPQKLTEKAQQAAGEMGKCCVASAIEGKGCCGKDAETVKAAYADYQATTAVKADMHKCCAESLAKGDGCCGMDAKELKADYTKKVTGHKAACSVKADMHTCCADALAKGDGCCGKEAKELKADYDKKVAKATEKLASK